VNLRQIKRHITISDGNRKVGSVPSISLPPVITCNPKAKCFKDCYVLKSYRIYPSVRQAYQKNLNTYNADPDLYFDAISAWLKIRRPTLFRYHVSGDIPDYHYLSGMVKLAAQFPEIKFLAFTKRYNLNKLFKNVPANLSIIISAWPGMRLPKTTQPIAFMDDGNEKRINNALECFGNCETCGMCWSLKTINKNVVFKKH
jgi:hypothetical protein